MTTILNAVMSGLHDRHVGPASGVLTTMQRGGNALGVAALEVPFFLTLSSAGARGLSQTASYIQAFGAVAFWNVWMLLAVVGLLLLLPDRTSGAIIPTDARTFAWSYVDAGEAADGVMVGFVVANTSVATFITMIAAAPRSTARLRPLAVASAPRASASAPIDR
jgi:hypothetical protein